MALRVVTAVLPTGGYARSFPDQARRVASKQRRQRFIRYRHGNGAGDGACKVMPDIRADGGARRALEFHRTVTCIPGA